MVPKDHDAHDGKRKPAGRPTEYAPELATQAEKLCELGATDLEIAAFFGIDVSTLYRWKHSHPEFCEALKAGKAAADERVERSLYHRAVGYTFQSEKVFQFQGEVVRAPTVEHTPPDVGACKLWLSNRRPDKWREQQHVTHGVDGPESPLAQLAKERR